MILQDGDRVLYTGRGGVTNSPNLIGHTGTYSTRFSRVTWDEPHPYEHGSQHRISVSTGLLPGNLEPLNPQPSIHADWSPHA